MITKYKNCSTRGQTFFLRSENTYIHQAPSQIKFQGFFKLKRHVIYK